MLRLRFADENGHQVKLGDRSSIGPDQWLIDAGEYTLLLHEQDGGKAVIHVMRTPGKYGSELRIRVGKTFLGCVTRRFLGPFTYPPPKPVRPPSEKIVSRPRKRRKPASSLRLKEREAPVRPIRQRPRLPEEIVEKTFVVDSNNPFLTYYCPRGNYSFSFVGEHHMRHLPYHGWNVKWVTQGQMIKWKMGVESPIGVLHPTLFPFLLGRGNHKHLNLLKREHAKIVGFDVADTTAVSPPAVLFANSIDLLIVPSQHSRHVYVKSGLKIPVEVVPHGLGEGFYAPKQDPLPQIPQDKINILFFVLHSPFRKGEDVVVNVMKRILDERDNVRLVVRGMRGSKAALLPDTICFEEYMSNQDVIRLIDSCQIGFVPSRGGGFELNVLEELARGLVVVTSDWPAIKEFAEPHALIAKSKGKVKILEGNPVHVGRGVNPDPNHCYELLNYALDNLEKLRKRSQKSMMEVREHFSWNQIVEKIAGAIAYVFPYV